MAQWAIRWLVSKKLAMNYRRKKTAQVSKIAIVNSNSFGKLFPEHIEELEKIGSVDFVKTSSDISGRDLARRLDGVTDIVFSGTPRFGREFFDMMDSLRLMTRHGLGFDNVDIKAASERGVIVAKVPGRLEGEAVAEHAVALALATMRRIPSAVDAVVNGAWSRRGEFVGPEIHGKTVGVIGFGNIGARVGAILREGFGAQILAHDPFLGDDAIAKRGGNPVTLEELLSRSDLISLNSSGTFDGRPILGGPEFSVMKRGVFIVNTSRGSLIDEAALSSALDDQVVAGVGLDVVSKEPADSSSNPLVGRDNVLVTPHIGAYSVDALGRMGSNVVHDIVAVSEGRLPNETVVLPQR
jgi:phosphoglycerate dehydrogenase-like enzyme